MAEPVDMILPMLREIRGDIAASDVKAVRRHELLMLRIDKLEDQQKSFRQALSADSLLSKLVTGEFEERIEALERQVSELLGRH
jgi:polyhydroxyalkanoate synthesis regulator phasin